MPERPALSAETDAETFRDYYWLKEDLSAFCRRYGLPVSGSKMELTERIARFLETGSTEPASVRKERKQKRTSEITAETLIESGFVCSELHREFFRKEIGNSFSFCVPFQKWLKGNAGKTYRDAIAAYREIIAAKKKEKAPIGRQFEYNTYIRDFFADNPGRTLADAVACWKYKKSRKGHNRYEQSDLTALNHSGSG